MRIRYLGLALLVTLGAYMVSSWNNKANAVPEMPVKKQGIVLVNVLEESLYNDCHIKCENSLNVPVDALDNCINLIDVNADVIVYCSNYQCASSDYAKKRLHELGFANVRVYEGGIAEWYQKGLPIEGLASQDYLKIVIEKPVVSQLAENEVITSDALAEKLDLVVAA